MTEFCFFRQKTAYEMRINDWSSDVCSSDLPKTQADQQRRKEEGNAPAPACKFRIVKAQPEQQEEAIRRDETHWSAKLREHAETRLPSRRRVFDCEQSSAERCGGKEFVSTCKYWC